MDLQQFSITRAGTANLTVPVWTIAGKVTNSKTGAVIRDFTGANVVSFPQVIGQLSAEQQDAFVQKVVTDLVFQRLGLA